METRNLALALPLLASPVLVGCAATFDAIDYHTVTPKVVEVGLDSKGPGWFDLLVANLGTQPLVLHRDRVTLHTAKGSRSPFVAPAGDTVVIAPGRKQEIKVRYATRDLPMYSMAALHFDHAFQVGTADVEAPFPMNLRVGQSTPASRGGPLQCCIHEPVAP